MVEPVALLLIGRGHPVTRARDVGLDDDEDVVIADYVLERGDLIVVTFDHDFRRSVVRKGCRCLHIRAPERTARDRLSDAHREVVARYAAGERDVRLLASGGVWAPGDIPGN
jgi:predicted nuclease of predicted toxin-antitoxin system